MHERSASRRTAELVEKLFLLARAVHHYGNKHPRVMQSAAAVSEAMKAASPPYELEVRGEGLFRDSCLIAVAAEQYEKQDALAKAFRRLSLQSVTVSEAPSSRELIGLGAMLAKALEGAPCSLAEVQIPGVEWQIGDDAGRDISSEEEKRQRAALCNAAAAVAAAERLQQTWTKEWPWALGATVVRRLESAVINGSQIAARALELVPFSWSPYRRAASAVLHTLAVLELFDTSLTVARAAAHATLVLALSGFRERSGLTVEQAVRHALDHCDLGPPDGYEEPTPHMLCVCAILQSIAGEEPDLIGHVPLTELVRICYLLELGRCPPEGDRDLSKVELLAGLTASDRVVSFDWLRALVQAAGGVPPGSVVQLPDGAIGITIGRGASRDPFCPALVVDGVRQEATGQIRLLSPSDLLLHDEVHVPDIPVPVESDGAEDQEEGSDSVTPTYTPPPHSSSAAFVVKRKRRQQSATRCEVRAPRKQDLAAVKPAEVYPFPKRAAMLEGMTGRAAGSTYYLAESDIWLMGRGEYADIPVIDLNVSRHHCELYWEGEVLRLNDLGSANGTLVNGDPVEERSLRPGDLVILGISVFRVDLVDSPFDTQARRRDAVFKATQFHERA
ncbi:FHA domain-containing protein [Planctomycetota bacterium]